MPFMSDMTNKENYQGVSDNDMIEVQVYDVGNLHKTLLMIWWSINTCDAQIYGLLIHGNKYLDTATH